MLSIIIPAHNRAALLARTLASVEAQTRSDWECIVVDDGSTEDVRSVVEAAGPAVRYVHQANAGPSVARNTGLAHATGDAVLFLDSDDLLLPSALDTLATTLDAESTADVAYGWFFVMTGEETPRSILAVAPRGTAAAPFLWGDTPAPVYGIDADGDVTAPLVQDDALVMGTALVRRAAVDRIGGMDPDVDFMEHWDFFLRLAADGAVFRCVREPVAAIRVYDGNRSQDVDALLAARLAGIERHVGDRPAVRVRAIARAHLRIGITHLAHDRFAAGLQAVGQALQHEALSPNAATWITERIHNAAFQTDAPARTAAGLAAHLGAAPPARAFRRAVLGSLHRRLARRVLRRTRGLHPTGWLHLTRSVLHDPGFVVRKLR